MNCMHGISLRKFCATCEQENGASPVMQALPKPQPQHDQGADDRELALRLWKEAMPNCVSLDDWFLNEATAFMQLCRAHFQPTPPSGWVTVPRGPTPEMEEAIIAAIETHKAQHAQDGILRRFRVWSAAISAAPTPPPGERADVEADRRDAERWNTFVSGISDTPLGSDNEDDGGTDWLVNVHLESDADNFHEAIDAALRAGTVKGEG